MSALLKIVCRVIARRVEAGEALDTVLADYPRLTEEEREQIQKELTEQTTQGGGAK